MTTDRWMRLFLVACLGVAAYGLFMVVRPDLASELFDLFGFGPESAGVAEGPARDYALFITGVLGAVIVGWMTLSILTTRAFLREQAMPRSAGGAAVLTSLVVWFVVDTGYSLVEGEWQHALFNVAFILVAGLPAYGWWRSASVTRPGTTAWTDPSRTGLG